MPLLNLAYSSGNETPQTEVVYQVYQSTQGTHAPPPPTMKSPWSRGGPKAGDGLFVMKLSPTTSACFYLAIRERYWPSWNCQKKCVSILPEKKYTSISAISSYRYHLHPLSYGYHLHPQLGPRETMPDLPFRTSPCFKLITEVWHGLTCQHILLYYRYCLN